ncbi:MAG: hypothetical protein KA314_05515 [Chloroflexi bacterium]|nr:hypothetical protein [Chloroflexota bacterium]MBP8055277.1 hypothetical protein [Chloroflexota bacterium]
MTIPTISPPSATLPWERQLTEADFFDPQLGDQFMQGYQHANDVEKAVDILRYVHQSNDHTLVTTNVWFAVTPDRQGFLVIDGDTEQVILPDRDRARVAEEQADYARQEAEIAQQEAEKAIKLAEAEASARLQAEQKLAEALAELARLRGETEA